MSEEKPLKKDVKRVRKIRRVGYVVLGLLSAYLAIPMLVSTLIGLSEGEMWDPYTGEPYDGGQDCYEQARDLLQRAEDLDRLESRWNEPLQEWESKCRDDHPDLNRLLSDTRAQLRGQGTPD